LKLTGLRSVAVVGFGRFLLLIQYGHFNDYCVKSGLIYKPYLFYLKFKFNQYKLLLGFTIPPNVFGPGLCIAHYGTIVVHNNARLGANIRINADVVIGENNGEENVPMIGNSVVIEPGAKIFGKITIADGIHIGANSVVNKSFDEPNVVIVGAPARVVGKIKI